METKKIKKILSFILAAVMLITAVPIGMLAAPMETQAATANELKEGTNYAIVSKQTGMAMTVSGFTNGNNATILQWPLENYRSQIWTLDYNNEGYCQIVNKHSGKVLNVPWASTSAGTAIIQFNKGNGDNDKWLITDVGEGYSRITPKLVEDFSLNIKDASDNRGAEVIQGAYTGADNEEWEFVEVPESAIQDNPSMDEQPDARLAIDSYIDKFFYVEDGLGKLRNMPSNGFWTDAEVLEMFIDAYEHLGDKKYLTVAEQFYDGIIARRSDDWEWNDYNDDVMWMVIASIRLYEHTGNAKHLEAAMKNFDMTWERGWDDELGGGLWWRTDNQTKNACVNSPAVIAAAIIAKQLEEDGRPQEADAYWQKAVQIWGWEYDVLFFPNGEDGRQKGEIMDNIKKDGTPVYWANTGNQGVFAGASVLLYEKYGVAIYKETAKLACDLAATMGDGEEGYLNREANSGDSIGGKGLLARWLGYYTDVCDDVDKYDDWMMRNACAAWFNRNSDNLMWGAFGRPTIEDVENCEEVFQPDNTSVTMKNYASWGCHSAVSWILNCTKLQPSDQAAQTSWEVKSLDGKTSMTLKLTDAGSLVYSIKQDNVTVVEESTLGINTSVGDFTNGLTFSEERMNSVNETYKVLSGKKSEYVNEARGREFVFKKGNVEFAVIIRAYNDGIAFRYGIDTGNTENFTIAPNSEITGIKVPDQATLWYMPQENDFMYERNYLTSTINDMAVGTTPSMPMLYKTGDKYILVTEAEKTGSYVGSILELENNRVLKTKFDPDQKNNVTTQAPFASPWRAFVIGDEATIVNNTMVENLSPAPDTSYHYEDWVKPGVSAWSWVSYEGRQDDPEVHKRFIDLAAKMGWEYYILDEPWQPKSTTNGSAYEGMHHWFDEVKSYADERGIKLIAWVNKSDVDTDAERQARFKEWSEKGIVGIKVDFFWDETQNTLKLHDAIYKDAADYKLLVNVHGSNPPSGEIRTYPNVIAREAIKGQEQGGITAEQYTIIPFIRAAVGTADVTEQLFSRDTGATTMGFQIALSTLVENGIRSLGSTPEEYYTIPEAASYYKDFPEKWDDTYLIDAEVGQYVDIARKSGDSWYAAGISTAAKDVSWNPAFLDSGRQYTAFIYMENGNKRDDLASKVVKNVTRDTTLSVHVQNGGGYAVKFVPQDNGIQSMSVFPSTLKVQAYQTKHVTVTVAPESLNKTDVTWLAEDDTMVKITPTGTGAIIKGLKEGKTKVTAVSVYDNTKKAEVQVEVTKEAYSLNTDKWTVLNDDADYLITGENSVIVEGEHGNIGSNVFAMKADANKDYEITAKISGDLFANYQGGFLAAFTQNFGNNVSAGRRYHQYMAINGNRNLFGMMANGNKEFYAADGQKTDVAYVMLKKEGNTFIGYYRFNETDDWTQIVNGDNTNITNANLNDAYVGFYASAGGTRNNIKVTFEDFRYNGELVPIGKTASGKTTETYTVEFDSAGGSNVAAQMVDANGKVTKPADPDRKDYKFNGWYLDGKPYDFDTAITKDMKLTAKWKTSKLLKFITLEAENAELSGGAQRNTNGDASGGYHAGNIVGTNAKVTFNVNTETDGARTMKVYYCTMNRRKFNVLLNGEVVTTLDCPGNGKNWNTISDPIELELELKAGANTIQFTTVNGEDAPNLDRIELELTELEGSESGGLEKVDASSVTLEGEVGEGDGYISYATDANASNGAYRGGMGGQMYGGVTYYVDAQATSLRNIKVYYCAAQARQLGIEINGVQVAVLDCGETGSWGTTCDAPVEAAVVLKEGTNAIKFTGVNGEFAPNLDKIEIELTKTEADEIVTALIDNLPTGLSAASDDEDKTTVTAVKIAYDSLTDISGITNADILEAALHAIGETGTTPPEDEEEPDVSDFEIEAEACALGGSATRVSVEEASNGCHVGYIGGNGNGTLTFNVNAEVAGSRELSVYYTNWGTRNLNVLVNGKAVTNLTCTGGSWNVPEETPVTCELELQKGNNTIQLAGLDGADGPNVDKFVIALTDTEAKNVVNDLINNNLPAQVTEANTAVVYAINNAYESLTDTDGIEGADKLAEALEQADSIINKEDEAPALELSEVEIELEAATLGGNASLVTGEYAQGSSNGGHIGNVGGNAAGTVSFKVNAEAAGIRTLKIYYGTLTARNLGVAVNDNELIHVYCPGTGGWSTIGAEPVETQIELAAGENTITFTGVDGAAAPNIDRIMIEMTQTEAKGVVENLILNLPEAVTDENKVIVKAVDKAYNNLADQNGVAGADKLAAAVESVTKLEEVKPIVSDFSMELEAAALGGSAELVTGQETKGISNGSYVGNIGGAGNGTATFTVYSETEGDRILAVYYSTLNARNLSIQVNDNEPVVRECAATGGWQTLCEEPLVLTVKLVKGVNTITFGGDAEGPDNGNAPNIDRIEIQLTDAEAKSAVENMINNLPDEVLEGNEDDYKAVVNAVNSAYVNLTDRNVEGVDKLLTAIAKVEEIDNKQEETEQPKPTVTVKDFAIELEASALEGTAALSTGRAGVSNGTYVNTIGGNVGSASFSVNADAAGERLLKVYYCTLQDRQLSVQVNGNEPVTANCPETGGWGTLCATPVVMTIKLEEGENIIRFAGVNGDYAPNIDRIEIQLTDTEAKNAVTGLIANLLNNLPQEVTDENKNNYIATVKAVNMAYEGLADKEGIEGVTELLAEVENVKELEGGDGGEDITPEPTPVISLKEYVVEAEGITVSGSAELVAGETAKDSSNNSYVGNLTGDGAVSFKVTTETAGSRLMKVYYCSEAESQLSIQVNNNEASVWNCQATESASKPCETPLTVVVELMAGENTIRFAGLENAVAPNIDRVEIQLTDAEAKSIAAEMMNNLINSLPEEVTAENVDSYKAKVQAVNKVYSSLTDNEGIEGADTLTQALENIKNFEEEQSQPTTPTPEVRPSVKEIAIELEAAKLGGSATLTSGKETEGISNGSYVGNLGGAGNGTATFTVKADAAGNRLMKIYYCSEAESKLVIKVNGTALETQTCRSTGGASKICENPLVVAVRLAAGDNTIEFAGLDNQPAPYIDYIVIQLSQAEEKNAVENLIANLPTEITDENKAVVDAVNKAYANLTDKTGVQGADALAEAVKKVEELKNNNADAEGSGGNNGSDNNGSGTGSETTGNGNGSTGEGNNGNGAEGENNDEGQQAQEVKVKKIKITGISKKIAAGKKITLTADISPENATNKAVKWTSSNKKYAIVNSKGRVSVKKAGKNKTVTITATAKDGSGVKAKYKIKIMPNAVKKVSIEAKTKTVKAGSKLSLKAVVTPNLSSKKMNKTIKWTSSNTRYATVSSKGVVKAKKAGKGKTVKITAAATDGSNKKKTIKIKIK